MHSEIEILYIVIIIAISKTKMINSIQHPNILIILIAIIYLLIIILIIINTLSRIMILFLSITSITSNRGKEIVYTQDLTQLFQEVFLPLIILTISIHNIDNISLIYLIIIIINNKILPLNSNTESLDLLMFKKYIE